MYGHLDIRSTRFLHSLQTFALPHGNTAIYHNVIRIVDNAVHNCLGDGTIRFRIGINTRIPAIRFVLRAENHRAFATHHQRIVLHRLQAAVTRHTTAVVVDLDNILRYANINFLSNQIVRNRVFVPTIRDAVIVGNLSHRPDGRLKRNCWQRQHDSQTFHIIVSGETGELLCKYDES